MVVTKADGSVKARHDYLPFGEDVASNISGRSTVTGYASQDSLRQKFTSKERDAESWLDYFEARYYSSAQGRFTTVDPYDPVLNRQIAANKNEAEEKFREYLRQPQHWNRYPYGLNNPLRYLDENGRQEIEAISKALVKAAGRLAQYKGILARGLTQAAVQAVLETAFGKTLEFQAGNLRYPHEIEQAKEIMYLENRSFMAVGSGIQPGIDGVLYDSSSFLNFNLKPQPISMTQTQGGIGSILNTATAHEDSAAKGGYNNVDLYIKATNPDVTVAQVVDFAKGGKQNLLEITKRGTLKSITIVVQEGVVRVHDGKVYAAIN